MFFILKNIAQFIRHSKVIFAVFVVCEITSLMLIIFSFGIYQNYSQQIKDIASDEPIDEEKNWISFDFESDIDEENPISNESVLTFLNEMGSALGNKIGYIDFDCGGYYVYLSYNDGWEMYDIKKNLKTNGMWYSGSSFSKTDYDKAAKVCIAPIECYKEIDSEIGYDDDLSPEDYSYQAYDKDGKIPASPGSIRKLKQDIHSRILIALYIIISLTMIPLSLFLEHPLILNIAIVFRLRSITYLNNAVILTEDMIAITTQIVIFV